MSHHRLEADVGPSPATPRLSQLAGKSILAFGDSLVHGHVYSRSFVDLVAGRQDMVLVKRARNGATIGPDREASGGQVLDQVLGAEEQAPDFVVFDGGTNDAESIHDRHAYPVGAVGAGLDPDDFDVNTFCGSLEQTLAIMKVRWPAAHFVYVAAHKLGSRDWHTQEVLRDVSLQAMEKWHVAVADVFGTTPFDTRREEHRRKYTFDDLVDGLPGSNGTGTHPNLAGMVTFYEPVVTATLASLVR
jgi:hypothetical protein